jgi:hypothetical protein
LIRLRKIRRITTQIIIRTTATIRTSCVSGKTWRTNKNNTAISKQATKRIMSSTELMIIWNLLRFVYNVFVFDKLCDCFEESLYDASTTCSVC